MNKQENPYPWEIPDKNKMKYVYKEKRPPNKMVIRIIGFILLNIVIILSILHIT